MSKVKIWLFVILYPLCGCTSKSTTATLGNEMGDLDSLYYPTDSIPSNGNYIHTCTSEDGNMKFYCWNTGEGGTMPVFGVLCQYRTNDGKSKVVDLGKDDLDVAWVSNVHSITKDNGQTYYIVSRSHRIASNDGYLWMDAYKIDCDTLKEVSVFDGGDDLDECMLEINYQISDWYTRTNDEGDNWLFEFDTKTRNLYVPQAIYTEVASPPILSDRYRLYHFDGMRFIDKGEVPHKGLHESLSQYSRLAKYFKTKNYIIRVDMLKDGDYRYASWKASSNMGEAPELVIRGGRYDEGKGTYSFANDGVEYIAGYSESKPIDDGIFDYREFLLVKKGVRILLKEERKTIDNN